MWGNTPKRRQAWGGALERAGEELPLGSGGGAALRAPLASAAGREAAERPWNGDPPS